MRRPKKTLVRSVVRHPIHYWLLIGLLIMPVSSLGQEEDTFTDEESVLEEDQDFPDLIHVDETGGVMDEFELLEDALTADEVISASKHRQSIFWSPSAVTVFTREDIRASGATTLPDLLRRVPNFDVYGMKPSYSLVGARALTNIYNNLVLLVVDGREELIELIGMAFWNGTSFDLEQVERIEVIRGPGSALYGANAFVAVVSITTVPDRPVDGGDVMISEGEQHHSQLAGGARGSFGVGGGSLSYGVNLGYEKALSPSDPRDESMLMLRSHNYLRYRSGRELDLSLHAGGLIGKSAVYLFTGDVQGSNIVYPWFMAKGEFAVGDSSRLKTQIYYNRYAGDLHFRTQIRGYDLWIADLPDIQWSSNTIDGQVHFVQTGFLGVEELLFIAGSNIRYSTLGGDENLLVHDNDEIRYAGFVHVQWEPIDTIQLTGGLRLDGSDLTELSLSPRGVIVFRPWSSQAFRLGYSMAFRKPSFFELLVHLNIDNYNSAFPEIKDKLATDIGNSELENMRVRSFEAGWQGRFLDNRLRVSVDLFYNIYSNSIDFLSRVPLRLGLPDIPNSTIGFENDSLDDIAYGSEVELTWNPAEDWFFWCNLGLRSMTHNLKFDSTVHKPGPLARVNLGGRYFPESGLFIDLAVHYVSTYKLYLPDPANIMDWRDYEDIGPNLLMIGRLGYRQRIASGQALEIGLTIRTPLGAPFREFPGVPMPPSIQLDSAADFGGEELPRQVSFYLRGSF
jgi:iron complex outermembrane receptor protein